MFQKDIQACEQKKYDLDQNTTLFWLKGKEVGNTSVLSQTPKLLLH